VGPYQVKGIISTNAIELDLPSMVKIHPVVNVNRVHRYKDQVEGQKKEQLAPVVIKREEEYEVEKILNKKKFRGKARYLVWWKGYTVEEDTWEPRENLENTEDLVKEFEKEYGEIRRVRKRRNAKEERKGELLGRYIAKMLYGWDDKKLMKNIGDDWKGIGGNGREKERIDEEKEEIEEWDEEDKMGKMGDIYNEL